MFFLAFTITLTGCGEKGLADNPPLEATVTSNGGMAVIKGDYLYFVNGYVNETSLTDKDNKAGHVTKGAIYRTKLSNGEIVKDKDGFLIGDRTDRVVSKVVGFGKGGFYIMDNYIIYATPCREISSDSDELQTSRVEFHRINIDGTNDKVLFVTSGTLNEWTTYKIGDTPYLVAHESGTLVSVNIKTGKTVGTVIDSSADASHAILKDNEYEYNESRTNFTQTHVIYTRAINEDDNVSANGYKGNVVCAFNIATGQSTTLEMSADNKYTIKHVTEDNIYYTYTNKSSGDIECLYKKSISNIADGSSLERTWQDAEEIRLTNIKYDGYLFVDYMGVDCIIANSEERTYLLQGDHNYEDIELLANSKEVIAVYGDYAYYTSDNNLVRFKFTDGALPETEGVYPEDRASIITDSNFLDFDGRRVYVYSEYTAENGDTNYYLNYFDVNIDEDNEFYQRFVGVFENDDVPAKPEQPEAEEGEEVEYVPHID